jgi:hypothetical protein
MLKRGTGIKSVVLMAITFVLLAFAPAVFAQEGTAALRGIVLDPNGAAVPGAQVSIANQETGLNRRTSTTGDDGDYIFTSLTPGLYRVTVEAANFKRVVKEGVKLDVGEEHEFKVSLEIGGASETPSCRPPRRRSAATSDKRNSSSCPRLIATLSASSACCPASCPHQHRVVRV